MALCECCVSWQGVPLFGDQGFRSINTRRSAAFVPAVRRIFRRGSDEESRVSSNDTEYAFRKSKGLLSGIKNAILGGGAFAKIAFFVFAILYVFQNEVTIRVARTLNKRLRKLTERVERGGDDISEADLRVFDGWRWRVMLW